MWPFPTLSVHTINKKRANVASHWCQIFTQSLTCICNNRYMINTNTSSQCDKHNNRGQWETFSAWRERLCKSCVIRDVRSLWLCMDQGKKYGKGKGNQGKRFSFSLTFTLSTFFLFYPLTLFSQLFHFTSQLRKIPASLVFLLLPSLISVHLY